MFTKTLAPIYINLPPTNVLTIVNTQPDIVMSVIMPAASRSIYIHYTKERLFKEHCLDCPYLEHRAYLEDLQGQQDNPERLCMGFDKLNKYNYNTCKREIKNIELELLKINVPDIMWSYSERDRTFRQYAVRNVEGTIYRYPYQLANVHRDGAICWGNQNKDKIVSLEQAVNKFWSLPFNSDLVENNHRSSGDLPVKLKTYDINGSYTDAQIKESSYHWTKCDDLIKPGAYLNDKQITGVSIWFDAPTLDLLPPTSIYSSYRVIRGQPITRCAIAAVTPTASGEFILDFNGFKIIKPKMTAKSKTLIIGPISL